MKKVSIYSVAIFTIFSFAIPFSTVFLIINNITNKINSQAISFISRIDEEKIEEMLKPKYPEALPTPEKVKGIYLTSYTFTLKDRRDSLIKLTEDTELNSFVIDIKDSAGKLMFVPKSEKLKNIPVSKMSLSNEEHESILKDLQNKNIYTIARVTTFQDPTAVKTFPDLALKNLNGGVWQNWQGITWLDMTNPAAWEISAEEALEAIKLGYDEIQFDYIRFPSDGNIRQIKYYDLPTDRKKYEVLTEFYKYADKKLEETSRPISIDLFGLTYEIRNNPEYDLNIGQRLIDASLYFDYISPMVYPSHYPAGYLGLANPAANPYPVVKRAMVAGNQILNQATSTRPQTRPWLQDFDIGADYNANMVRAQINAAEENNASGWLLWNPLNRYTTGALKKE